MVSSWKDQLSSTPDPELELSLKLRERVRYLRILLKLRRRIRIYLNHWGDNKNSNFHLELILQLWFPLWFSLKWGIGKNNTEEIIVLWVLKALPRIRLFLKGVEFHGWVLKAAYLSA